ncbi:MAG: hypothetical protein HYY06_14810 [Deltaproteobacteria bacterium]|nr:hypothetical protein [Deltaproteobacteria bacterium]
MERVNLNLPTDARRKLKGLAKRRGRSEAVLARELVLEALEREEREEFLREVARTQTPEATSRDLEILGAFEGLDG